MLKEFREFAFKGNMLDMAIGIIIGGAFSKLVNSFVSDIVMPIFGYLTSGIDFKTMSYPLQHEDTAAGKPEILITYGNFIDTFINLLIMALTLFFVIKLVSTMRVKLEAMSKAKEEEQKAEEAPAAPVIAEDVALLTEIRDLLRANAGQGRE